MTLDIFVSIKQYHIFFSEPICLLNYYFLVLTNIYRIPDVTTTARIYPRCFLELLGIGFFELLVTTTAFVSQFIALYPCFVEKAKCIQLGAQK